MSTLTVDAVSGGGSEWTFLEEGSISTNFTIDTSSYSSGTYDDLKLILMACEVDTDTAYITVQLDHGGGVETGLVYEYVVTNLHSSVSTANKVPVVTTTSTTDLAVCANVGNAAGYTAHAEVEFFNVSATSTDRQIYSVAAYTSAAGDSTYMEGVGKMEGATSGTLDGIKVVSRIGGSDNGTIDAGSYRLFGREAL